MRIQRHWRMSGSDGTAKQLKGGILVCKHLARDTDDCRNRLPTTPLYRERFCRNRPDKCPVYNYFRVVRRGGERRDISCNIPVTFL